MKIKSYPHRRRCTHGCGCVRCSGRRHARRMRGSRGRMRACAGGGRRRHGRSRPSHGRGGSGLVRARGRVSRLLMSNRPRSSGSRRSGGHRPARRLLCKTHLFSEQKKSKNLVLKKNYYCVPPVSIRFCNSSHVPGKNCLCFVWTRERSVVGPVRTPSPYRKVGFCVFAIFLVAWV
jgi:hypothetical protein